MGFKWLKLTINDVCSVTDCQHKTAPVVNFTTDYRMLRTVNIRNGNLRDIDDTKSVTKETYEKWSVRGYLKPGDIILTREAPMGEVALLRKNEKYKYFLGQRMLQLQGFPEVITPEFLYYSLQTRDLQHQIKMNEGTGSVVSNIRIPLLKKMKLNVPPLVEQKKITKLLFAIDNKILLNNKIISNLEQLSQTLFKHWFIDFEFPNEEGKPYKSSGGEMVGCALDRIPINWENTNLKYLSKNIFAGGTPNRKEESYWTNPEIPWLKTKEITNNFILNTEEYISLEGLKNSSAKWANPNSIVIAMYGATAGRVGYIANKLTTNQASCVIETNYPNYVWSYLKKNQEHIKTMATGSAQQNLNKSVISNLKIPHPGNELLELYEAFVSPNTELCINLCKENDNLQQLRDTLLPKLLSGEIEISDDLEV